MNLSSFDLNLLKVLSALLTEGSTTGAAQRVGLSQPAVSAALSRLRASLNDPLFVRQGQRLAPTSFAMSLTDPLGTLLTDLEGLLTKGDVFDANAETATFVLTGSDYFAELLMPRLARDVLPDAPNVVFQIIELEPTDYLGGIRSGRADIALIPSFALEDWACHDEVFTSDFAVIARCRHPATRDLGTYAEMPLDLFCTIPQIVFSVEGKTRAQTDTVLEKQEKARRVVMTMADFSGIYRAVASSDLISVIPAELALSVAEAAGLDIFRPPVSVGPVPIHMAWHRRSEQSPAHKWLRDTVATTLRDIRSHYALPSSA